MKIIKNFKKMVKKVLKKKANKKFKRNKMIFLVILFLILFSLYNISVNYFLEKEISSLETKLKHYNLESKKIKIDRVYFNTGIRLKNYDTTRYKIEDSGKNIINNIRNLHKSPVLIAEEYQDRELCAGYIWNLSEKIWGKKANYNIGMYNSKKPGTSQAWELPHYYESFGGKILIDLSEKFSLDPQNYLEKISKSDLKDFFSKSFSEESLFGDIGFFYTKTKYIDFLKKWSSNSHITKNMGISDFEFTFGKIDDKKSNLHNFMDNLGCEQSFEKYISLLENYELYLNSKRITFYKNDFYYLEKNDILGEKLRFKYLDKINYKDITIAHFFEGKSHVDSLFKFSCDLEFYPVNIIQINSRMIEKI